MKVKNKAGSIQTSVSGNGILNLVHILSVNTGALKTFGNLRIQDNGLGTAILNFFVLFEKRINHVVSLW